MARVTRNATPLLALPSRFSFRRGIMTTWFSS